MVSSTDSNGSGQPGDTASDAESSEADAEGVPWSRFLAEAQLRFERAGIESAPSDARRIIEEVGGYREPDGTTARPFASMLDELATVRGVAAFDAMVTRRLAGEPVQYVLGNWAFRSLDLFVDQRVLIPRPETEQVVEAALARLRRSLSTPDSASVSASGSQPLVVDLGTGSGAIALSVATEVPTTQVWATDVSAAALEVARANLAGAGRAAARIRLAQGDWFEALPDELRGRFDLVIANPPYIGDDEVLPASVADWEPVGALRCGPDGSEALVRVIDEASQWIAPGGTLVLEMASPQVEPMMERVASVGFVTVERIVDLAGLDRGLAAQWPGSSAAPGSAVPLEANGEVEG